MNIAKSASLLALSTVGIGCGGTEGTWILYIPANLEDPADYCANEVDHNFSSAEQPDGDGGGPVGWTEESDAIVSDGAVTAQITLGGGEGMLVVGDSIFTGEKDGSDWVFTWNGKTETLNERDHDSGYSFYALVQETLKETMTLTISGSSLEGTNSIQRVLQASYEESDEFDAQATQLNVGQIPSRDYLVMPNPKGGKGVIEATNQPTQAECGGGTCELDVIEECLFSLDITGERLAGSDAYSSANRPSGVPQEQEEQQQPPPPKQ